jgi:hypothetical protein
MESGYSAPAKVPASGALIFQFILGRKKHLICPIFRKLISKLYKNGENSARVKRILPPQSFYLG